VARRLHAGEVLVANRGQPDIERAVVASLLRWGADTRAPRLFKDMCAVAGGTSPSVRQLSGALEARPDRRVAAERSATLQARAALDRARACEATPLIYGDPGYPPRLAEIVDPPIVLWAAGRSAALANPAVAIVGSRHASPAGLATARRLGRDLARAGLTVVSGLALGIDAAAHEGALDGGGQTVAVLGCGVDVVYPRQHGQLISRIRTSGCVVSELPPATPPLPRHFPLRNRVISGLSLVVVVVEAAERSGSLITARTALEQGRDVLAVPGPVVSGCHRGCHALIKDGAGLVETADDVLATLGWRGPGSRVGAAAGEGLAGQMVAGEPVSLDDLAARAGRPAADVLADLGVLEVEGVVARMAGGLFVKLD
jgi:DNA processing protein